MLDNTITVPRQTLYQLERETAHVTNELEGLIDQLPSKFRKQVRGLTQEAAHIHEDIRHIKGLYHSSTYTRTDFAD